MTSINRRNSENSINIIDEEALIGESSKRKDVENPELFEE